MFLIPFAYLSVESTDCILLLLFELYLKSYLSLLNLCYDFKINLLFFMNSL